MASLDFKEIAAANEGSGRQDSFELFARDALAVLGFTILIDPSRGADGGKDLIVEERRVGPLSETRFKWLVSCKHFAHSGKSVSPQDELNVLERVKAAQCRGFLGFYSTLPSAGLRDLIGVQTDIDVKLLDHEEIERRLLESLEGRLLINRFFPASCKSMKQAPAELYVQRDPIICEYCGKELLNPPSGIWVLWRTQDRHGKAHYLDMHFACKGDCDDAIESMVHARHAARGYISSGWDDVQDMQVPTVFITKVMGLMDDLNKGNRFEPEALRKMKRLLSASFLHVSRPLTAEDQDTIANLREIPLWLGGLGPP
jgi:hypothetical protein